MAKSDYLKNKAIRSIYDFTITIKPHSGDPGPNGTDNMLNGAGNLLNSDLIEGDTGELINNISVALGITDPLSNQTITYVSSWDGDNYLDSAPLAEPWTVLAGTSPRIKKGAIIFKAE